MKKPVILTNFGYQRKNWIAPLESLRDEFEIVYIHYNHKEDETGKFTDSKVLYFSDFKDAWDLINSVKPDIFLAMGLNGNNIFAIKHVCNQLSIPFCYMDHGIYGGQKSNKQVSVASKSVVNADDRRTRNISFAFNTFINSFSFIKGIVWITFILLTKVTKKNISEFSKVYRYLSKPDVFLTYSIKNNQINQRIYQPSPDQVKVIGNYEYDVYRKPAHPLQEPDYLLMIDAPLSDNPFGFSLFSTQFHYEIYKKINLLAKRKSLKLKIKLHPCNYKSEWMKEMDNIEFIREYPDLNSLIRNAKYCIGFQSTLLIPAIYFKPTSVLKAKDHDVIDFIAENNICNIYDIYDLDENKIKFKETTGQDYEIFRETYFDLSDDPSIQRLKKEIIKLINKN